MTQQKALSYKHKQLHLWDDTLPSDRINLTAHNMEQKLKIVEQFDIVGTVTGISPIGNGLINDTYQVPTASPDTPDYILQRINHHIFKDVDLLQRNIQLVTDHIREKLAAAGEEDIERKVLRLIPARDGKLYYHNAEDDSYWRVTVLIPRSVTYETMTPRLAELTGVAFGNFQSQLSDFDSTTLFTVIPHFHDMGMRFSQLRNAMKLNHENRMSLVQKELEFLFDNEERGKRIWDSFENGTLPMRVTHNDTKINNVLFSKETGEALCVIDLDTIMPGTILFDTGDMIRTACSTADEDEKETEKMEFSIPFYKALYEGYMESAGSFLTEKEKEGIKESGRTITQIMAVRFLTDYLQGDTYYKIAYPDHNLVRARTQIALMQSMDRQWKEY